MATADVIHDEPGAAMPRHRPEYSDMCDICKPRIERNRRITKSHQALVEFGYAGLTREQTAEAYDIAIARQTTAADGVIAMFIRGFLRDAGMVE